MSPTNVRPANWSRPRTVADMPETISVSGGRMFQRCQRLYYYSYVCKRELARDSPSQAFGKAVHKSVETKPLSYGDIKDPFERAHLRALMAGYFTRWEDDSYEDVAKEIEFLCPITNPWTGVECETKLHGFIDGIVRNSCGIWIRETKTTSEDASLGSSYWRSLDLDSQVSVYYDGLRALGHDPVGCLYDVVHKTSLSPLKATPEDKRRVTKAGKPYAGQRLADETPDEYHDRIVDDILRRPDWYYQRGRVFRLETEEFRAKVDLWNVVGDIVKLEELGSSVAHNWTRSSGACRAYGQLCGFFEVCTGRTSIQDLRFRDKRK
jgi:hypothetical protein